MKSHCQRTRQQPLFFPFVAYRHSRQHRERPSPVQENLIADRAHILKNGGKLTVAVAKITTAWANYRMHRDRHPLAHGFSVHPTTALSPLLGLRIIQLCLRRFAAPLVHIPCCNSKFPVMPFLPLITPTARWQRSLQWTTDET